MRHRKAGTKLQRNPSSRRALLRGLTTSVILEDRVITTVTKAKAVKPVVEKMITLGKRDTLHSRRQAASYLQTPDAVKRLFDTLAPRFAERKGGYTRVVRLGPRKGDGAEMALIEILGAELKKRAEERRKRREERMKQQQEEETVTEDSKTSETGSPVASS
ncbi:MAG: 50S ribosomal protein L17 [Solibacterales bacterium]|nr:50S ribosomal protein L17 [Bryobacterales bacterium]|tara:strand:- start:16234 stop:16716 length:483 start_codon:yes stop_codon:yes gene_type:complete